ncbi:MAG: CDP-3,6-dideoxy-D-glycero-L-glycero-4-hexulose-4-reductase [Chloroflexi bacterium 13_1_20CM_50_12]|nr:MAG: CDP-3,6-dideoxy-D-glycero-L-glycero-4-hexulose-4-reductase [Chloroflexi bacterium 13_1_20CM_50_12]
MPTIVSVHSYRGGTGKSNLVANLAGSVAQMGKRAAVIDTDVQSPGLHVLFGMDVQTIGKTLNDYLYGRCGIEQAAHDVTAKLGPGVAPGGILYLVPSSIKAGEITRVLREGYEVNLLTDGLRTLMKTLRLDYLFIDTHPGLNEETLLSIILSDILILLLRPDQQDFQGTAVTIDVTRKLKLKRLVLVVNNVLPKLDFIGLRQQVEATYAAPVAAILPVSEEMMELGSASLFSVAFPSHLYSKGVREIAAQIVKAAEVG